MYRYDRYSMGISLWSRAVCISCDNECGVTLDSHLSKNVNITRLISIEQNMPDLFISCHIG